MQNVTKKFGRVSDLADALGLKRRRIYQLVELGKISPPVNKLFDMHLAIGEYTANTDIGKRETDRLARGKTPPPLALARATTAPAPAKPRRSRPAADTSDPVDYNESRALKERYAALSKRADYLAAIGKLVAIEDVEAREVEVGRLLTERVLGLPARLAHDLSAEAMRKLVHETEQLIREIHDRLAAITDFSHAWQPPAISEDDARGGRG